ncbi:MAG: hypothetical protein LBQ42_06340 [Synergistaceae bacterium]|jgi:hypothetical protein|nr:hypothetical protein [Synergistaceae bacterium]
MRYRNKRRVDWDEELRKTERIRRKGLFVSALGFGVAAIFVVGAGRMGPAGVDVSRKLLFALCFVAAMFLARGTLRRGERLRREREEREEALALSRIKQNKNAGEEEPR